VPSAAADVAAERPSPFWYFLYGCYHQPVNTYVPGLKLSTIRDLEQERNRPTWESVLAFAGGLDVDCNAFVQQPALAVNEKPKRGGPQKTADGVESGKKPGKRK
jgi:hypothetical protein